MCIRDRIYVSGTAVQYFYGKVAAVFHKDLGRLLVWIAAVFQFVIFHHLTFLSFLFIILVSVFMLFRSVYAT